MNKAELITAFWRSSGLKRPEAKKIVEIFFESMADYLSRGHRVEIRGLCSFYVKQYDPYTGRNPKTGEQVEIPPKKLPFFKCGKELTERVDYKKRKKAVKKTKTAKKK